MKQNVNIQGQRLFSNYAEQNDRWTLVSHSITANMTEVSLFCKISRWRQAPNTEFHERKWDLAHLEQFGISVRVKSVEMLKFMYSIVQRHQ